MTIGAEEIYDDGPLYAAAKKVYPQKVWGTYRRLKWIALWIALGVYYILPFIRWNRGPNQPSQAVLVDIAAFALLRLLHRAVAAGGVLFHRPPDPRPR